MRSAVVTGANGMIGSALVRELLANGSRVLALVREGENNCVNLPQHPLLCVRTCGLGSLAAFQPSTDDVPFDVMYHFAWNGTFGSSRDDAYLQNDNLRYTLDAISLAARLGCRRFVGAGSQAEYGITPPGQKLSPATPTAPDTGYGIAKLAAGCLGGLHAASLGIHFNWVRILSVYGPAEKPHCLTMSTILSLLRGQSVHFTKGEQLWDFLYCEDAARAFRLIGEKGVPGQIYVLGSGQTISLADAITTLCNAINPAARIGLGDLPYPQGQRMYLCADISKLTEDTGFTPQVSYPKGILQTIHRAKEQL